MSEPNKNSAMLQFIKSIEEGDLEAPRAHLRGFLNHAILAKMDEKEQEVKTTLFSKIGANTNVDMVVSESDDVADDVQDDDLDIDDFVDNISPEDLEGDDDLEDDEDLEDLDDADLEGDDDLEDDDDLSDEELDEELDKYLSELISEEDSD